MIFLEISFPTMVRSSHFVKRVVRPLAAVMQFNGMAVASDWRPTPTGGRPLKLVIWDFAPVVITARTIIASRPWPKRRRHRYRIWPNLARRLEPMATNQLWVADITYVRLSEQFAYLAVILDAFSRRVVGWAMADHLRAELALAALEMALAGRAVTPGGLVHHSDRGVQYACGDYIARLEENGILVSMSRLGCPYDNAMAESFMKTLKTEEVEGLAYRDLDHASNDIGGFIETVYNRQRLHSALAYRSPEEFERDQPEPWAAARRPVATDATCP